MNSLERWDADLPGAVIRSPHSRGRALTPARSGAMWVPGAPMGMHRQAAVRRLGVIGYNLTGASVAGVRAALDRAWGAVLCNRGADAHAAAARAELRLGDLAPAAAQQMATEVATIRAAVCVLQDDIPGALALARRAMGEDPGAPLGKVAATICRLAYWRLGDLERFHAVGRPGTQRPTGKREVATHMLDRAIEAAVEAQQLRLFAARQLAQDALELAPPQAAYAPAAALAAAVLAQLLHEQGKLDDAQAVLREHLPLIRLGGSLEAAIRAYPLLARIATRRRQGEFAALLLREGETLGLQADWPRLVAACRFERVDLLAAEGRIEEAEASLEKLMQVPLGHASPESPSWRETMRYMALGRTRLALAKAPNADLVAVIRRLHHEAIVRQDLLLAFQLAIRLVHGLSRIGEIEEAARLLSQLLDLGANVGLYQSILDGGPHVRAVLSTVYERAVEPGGELRYLASYIGSLIDHWPAIEAGGRSARPALRSSGPLSQRECHILRLFARGFSNKRTAIELGIASETVKSHAKNIFLKLAAQTRAEAVSRAESLGFI